MKWQNAASTKKHALEHLPLLRQIFMIAWRHREVVGPLRTIPRLVAWAATPRQLGSYGIEIISMFAPRSAHIVREAARRIMNPEKASSA